MITITVHTTHTTLSRNKQKRWPYTSWYAKTCCYYYN